MIKLIEGYYIFGGDKDYILKRSTGKLNKDDNAKYRIIGYYGSVASAIKGCFNDLARTTIKDSGNTEIDLERALTIFTQLENRLEDIIPDTFRKK